MKFGPAEMAQMMDGAKALLTVAMIFSVGIGIVLGVIVALYRSFSDTTRPINRSDLECRPVLPLPILDLPTALPRRLTQLRRIALDHRSRAQTN